MKCLEMLDNLQAAQSHPARGAWIEIPLRSGCLAACAVAPRKGCVD